VRRATTWRLFLALLAGAVAVGPVTAQPDSSLTEVYVMRTPPGVPAGTARLFFIDSLTAQTITVDVSGDRFAILGGYVLYQDPAGGTIYRAWPDGRIELHPFIQPAPETRRIDWVISPDRQWIAWTLANQTGEGLQTITTLARADGTSPRVILTDGPDTFLRVMPLALTADQTFFFDRQPQGVGDFFFYRQYATLHRLNLSEPDAQPEPLPFEPNCFCGGAVSANGRYFARLEQVSPAGGYDVRVWDLAAGVDVFARSLNVNYQAAGAVLVAADGRRVVYSLANNLTVDSAASGRERFMLALVDVARGEQRQLIYNPLLVPLLPLDWTEDGSGVLLYNPRQDGTWKITLETGEVRQVAAATWLGYIGR